MIENTKTLSAIGAINVSEEKPSIDVDLQFDEFTIEEFSPLATGVLEDIRGLVSGRAKISGNYKDPSIDGVLYLNRAGLMVPYLNVDLDFEDNSKVILEKTTFLILIISILQIPNMTQKEF